MTSNKRPPIDYDNLAATWQRQAEDWSDPDEAPQLPAVRNNFVPGRNALERVPAMPALAPSDPGEDGAFAVASGQALAAGAGGVFEHTSAADRARADMLRLAYYVGGLAVLVIGLAFTWWTPWGEFGAVLALLGGGAMTISLFVHIAGMRHSQAGVARHKVDTIRAMHRDRLESRERMATQMSGAWLSLVERQLEHDRRMEEMRYRNGRK